MFTPRKPLFAAAAVGAIALTGIAVAGSSAGATPSTGEGQTVNVTYTAQGAQFKLPPVLVGGSVHFWVTDADKAPHSLDVFRLKPGATLAKTMADINTEVSAMGPPAAAATRALTDETRFIGGVDLNPGTTAESTSLWVTPGTYYAIDPSAGFTPGGTVSVLQTLTVAEWGPEHHAPYSGRVTITKSDRFVLDGRFNQSGTVFVYNDGDSIHFMDLVPVKPGTTDAQLQKFFDSFGPGGPTLPDPETGPPVLGESVASPHSSQALSYSNVPPGSYALECFIADAQTGMPHAFMGMHLIIHVN
jgi:hypothetical protein